MGLEGLGKKVRGIEFAVCTLAICILWSALAQCNKSLSKVQARARANLDLESKQASKAGLLDLIMK